MGLGAHAYAKGTGGVSDYNTGLQHAMGNRNPSCALGAKQQQIRQKQDEMYAQIGDAITAGGVIEGAVGTIATAGLGLPIALILGATISSAAAKGASEIGKKGDEYDDIGNAIAQVISNFPDTNEYLVIQVSFGKNGEPDAYASIKEEKYVKNN